MIRDFFQKKGKLVLRWLLILVILLAAGSILFPGKVNNTEESSIAFPVMSTVCSVTLYGKPSEMERAFREVRSEMEKTVSLCNIYNPSSELSRLNREASGKPFKCSPALWELLTLCRKYHALTDGYFDPSIVPLSKLWKRAAKEKKVPSEQETGEALALTGMGKIVFDDEKKTVFFPAEGFALDFGGIAKGCAVDRAVEKILTRTEIRSGFVDLGGNIRFLPEAFPGKTHYAAGIRDPLGETPYLCTEKLLDESIATSGSYERFIVIGGKKYSHIINPKTGYPAEGKILSSSVISPLAADADALSTGVFLGGERLARKLPQGFRAVLILNDSGKKRILRISR